MTRHSHRKNKVRQEQLERLTAKSARSEHKSAGLPNVSKFGYNKTNTTTASDLHDLVVGERSRSYRRKPSMPKLPWGKDENE